MDDRNQQPHGMSSAEWLANAKKRDKKNHLDTLVRQLNDYLKECTDIHPILQFRYDESYNTNFVSVTYGDEGQKGAVE